MKEKPSILVKLLEWAGGICFAAGILFQYITIPHLILLGYLLVLRGSGLFLAFHQAFGRDPEAEAFAFHNPGYGTQKVNWPDILCPFLDTDCPQDRGRALAQLRAAGLSDGSIRLVRGLVGIGFVILVADEWIEFSFSDLKARWTLTLLLDAAVSIVIYLFCAKFGLALGGLWLIELAIFLGILGFDRFVVQG